jgi:hypothetical protein
MRSHQQFVPEENKAQKPMVPPKTSNSSKRGTIVKYNIPLKNDLNKALNTLGTNVETISRQEAVAIKPTGGHKK